MPIAHEIAAKVLPIFGKNVVAKKAWTYGQYAHAIGREPAEYGQAIGKAMHAIGALCVIKELPVAPLHWVKRAGGGYRKIFESDPIERKYIIESNDIKVMYIVSREYRYTMRDFELLENTFNESLESGLLYKISLHELWHLTFKEKVEGLSKTYYERAMEKYHILLSQFQSQN